MLILCMKLKDVQLIAYDKKGNIIDVEIVPNKVNATITIASPSKVVPIKVIPEGKVAFGKAISKITTSIDTVTIYGDEEALANIKNIEVPVNVEGLSDAKKFTETIKKPAGVRSMSETVTSISVSVETEISKELENVQLVYENLSGAYSINAASDADKYATVIVKGVESVLKDIDENSVKVYVDLSGYGPGTHDVDVLVEGNDVRVSYETKVKKVTLIISQRR